MLMTVRGGLGDDSGCFNDPNTGVLVCPPSSSGTVGGAAAIAAINQAATTAPDVNQPAGTPTTAGGGPVISGTPTATPQQIGSAAWAWLTSPSTLGTGALLLLGIALAIGLATSVGEEL